MARHKNPFHSGVLESVEPTGGYVTVGGRRFRFLDPRYWASGSSHKAYEALRHMQKMVGKPVQVDYETHSAFGDAIFGRRHIKRTGGAPRGNPAKRSKRQARFQSELKKLLKRGVPAAKAMKTAWRRVPKNPRKITRTKARKILHHGAVHGVPLSPEQRGLFGAIASGYRLRKYRNPRGRRNPWSTFAGGTSAAPGKYSYSIKGDFGDYHIWPVSSRTGRHLGYKLMWADTKSSGIEGAGLWHDIGGTSSRYASLMKRAREHAKRQGYKLNPIFVKWMSPDPWTGKPRQRHARWSTRVTPRELERAREFIARKSTAGPGRVYVARRAENPLSRKHYQAIAGAVREAALGGGTVKDCERELERVLKSDNAAFDPERFRAAALGNPPPVTILGNGRVIGEIRFRPTRGRKVSKNPRIDIRV